MMRPKAETSAATTRVARAVNVSRWFADRQVLVDVNLELERGEFVALLGPSGCGKSTFLKVLAGLDPGAQGSVQLPERRAVVFQEPRLLPWKRVLDNVSLGLRAPRAERSTRARLALEEVQLSHRADAWPLTLSGGEAQRAALARALTRDPELLLLDEPFGALDALTRLAMHRLLAELCAKHSPAVLLVTHDVDEAVSLADRVLVFGNPERVPAPTSSKASSSIVAELRVDVPAPRRRGNPRFDALRRVLLEHLGVEDDDWTAVARSQPNPRRELASDARSAERVPAALGLSARLGSPSLR